MVRSVSDIVDWGGAATTGRAEVRRAAKKLWVGRDGGMEGDKGKNKIQVLNAVMKMAGLLWMSTLEFLLVMDGV